MRYSFIAIILGLLCVAAATGGARAPAPNGITLPEGYKDWRVIGIADRTDNHTMRAILGNDAAVAAAREGRTKPWPDGAILAKVAWKTTTHPHWSTARVPGEFVQAEFMIKDAKKYAATGGWGFARWKGMDQKPYGQDAKFVQECFACHTPVKEQDYVFTRPVVMP